MPKWSVLFLPAQQCGCSAGSRSLSLSILLAYWPPLILLQQTAEVCGFFVFCNSNQEELDDDLYRRATWSADHWQLINKTKCAECLFYSKNIFSQHQLFLINGESVSRDQTVKYLGEYITSNMTWCTHMNTVFTKCLRLSFFNRRLRTMNAQWCFHGELFQSVLSL